MPIADKINRGDILQGNLYVSPTVTPLVNDQIGPNSENVYQVGTGKVATADAGAAGRISQLNEME